MGTALVLGKAGAVAAAKNAIAGTPGAPVVGAGSLAPLIAPALAIGATAGPMGWVALAGAAMSGIVIVAGDNNTQEWNCWEHVLRIDEMNSAPIPESRIEACRKHGMLMGELVNHCEVLKTEETDDYEKLILKNQLGEYFAFAISLVVPAGTYEEGQNATHDVTVVHAVKVEPIEQV